MKKVEVLGVVLAGGKGSRMNSHEQNKTTLDFNGQPILSYGLKLLATTTDQILVVKGAFGESVVKVVKKFAPKAWLVTQRYRLGTGHAVVVANRFLKRQQVQPRYVVIGYGDHMMFYHAQTVTKMIDLAKQKKAAIVMIEASVDNPFGLGRVIKNKTGGVERIVEEKVATAEEKKIKDINAGLYCFEYQFLDQYLGKLKRNPVSNEYYLTDLIEMAIEAKREVWPLAVPFSEVGIGINTKAEMIESEKLFVKQKSS